MKTLEQRKAGTTCSRCHEQRWPYGDWTEPYTCQRCREALAGGNARDPLPSEAQQAARAANALKGRSFAAKGGVGEDRAEVTTAPEEPEAS